MTEALFRAAEQLKREGRLEEAAEAWRKVLALDPGLEAAHFNLGNTLALLGRHAEAEAAFRAVLARSPGDAEAMASVAIALREQGRFEDAEAALRRAVALRPEAADLHNDLGNLLLGRGAYEEGWRHRCRDAPAWRPAMRGARLRLVGDQGLGDQVFYLRFAARLGALGCGPLVAQVDPRLGPMLGRTGVFGRIAAPGEADAPQEIRVRLSDLPRFAAAAGAQGVPAPLALQPAPALVEEQRRALSRLGPAPYLAVTWRTGAKGPPPALLKEIPPAPLAAALRQAPGTVLALQREATDGELRAFSAALGRPVADLSGETEDLERLLALLEALDDCVGVSSTSVHLRAGLGRGGRVLVPMPPMWRWMQRGEASPWFPGFKVYRQSAGRSWDDALEALARDVAAR